MSEEDWEKTDIDLAKLKIQELSSQETTEESEKASATNADKWHSNRDHDAPPELRIPETANMPVDVIDPVLLDSIQNENRIYALQCENMILNFVNSSSQIIEIRQQLNTYQRLLFYRIADRFFINHSYNDYNEFGAKSLALCKTSYTRIPNPLLVDVPMVSVDGYRLVDLSISGQSTGSNAAQMGSLTPNVQEGESGTAPKKLLLKRSPVSTSSSDTRGRGSSRNTSGRSSYQSGSDKEKLYAEAKARIFRESLSSSSPSGEEANSDTVSAPVAGNDGVDPRATPGESAKRVPEHTTAPHSSAEAPVLHVPIPQNAIHTNSSTSPVIRVNSSSPGVTGSSVNLTKTRFTPRDVVNEKSDPDFVRSRPNTSGRSSSVPVGSNVHGTVYQQQPLPPQPVGGYAAPAPQGYPAAPYSATTPPGYYGGLAPGVDSRSGGPGYYAMPGQGGYYSNPGQPQGYSNVYAPPPGPGYMYGYNPGTQYPAYPVQQPTYNSGRRSNGRDHYQGVEEQFPPLSK